MNENLSPPDVTTNARNHQCLPVSSEERAQWVLNELTNGPISTNYYDLNGNLTNNAYDIAGDCVAMAYDDENRLIDIYNPITGLETVFVYDGLGRLRIRQELSSGGGSFGEDPAVNSETRYIYDGWRPMQERNASNVPQVTYTRATDLSGTMEGAGGIGGLLARSHGYSSGTGNWSTHNYYFADGNGNITYLVNSSQGVAAKYRYDPFGNTISSSGSLASANVYRFSSKEIHVNSGMYYYGHRFYDPSLQRWLNRDPLSVAYPILVLQSASRDTILTLLRGVKIEQIEGPNLFSVVLNNPISYLDPFGREHVQEPGFTKPLTPGNVGPMWPTLWDCVTPKYQGKICRAACWAAGGACTALCPVSGPGLVLCLAGCGAAASLCSDACPP